MKPINEEEEIYHPCKEHQVPKIKSVSTIHCLFDERNNREKIKYKYIYKADSRQSSLLVKLFYLSQNRHIRT